MGRIPNDGTARTGLVGGLLCVGCCVVCFSSFFVVSRNGSLLMSVSTVTGFVGSFNRRGGGGAKS